MLTWMEHLSQHAELGGSQKGGSGGAGGCCRGADRLPEGAVTTRANFNLSSSSVAPSWDSLQQKKHFQALMMIKLSLSARVPLGRTSSAS